MASRCSYCAGLSIRVLVDLAEKEFRTGRFPSQAFYQHHASIRDLEASSEAGCDLCRLILDHLHDASKTGGVQDDQSTGVALSPSGTARDLADSSVLMAINCDGAIPSVSHSQLNMDLTVFDEIMVQVGRPDKSQEAWRESQNITLHLSLTIPDGTLSQRRTRSTWAALPLQCARVHSDLATGVSLTRVLIQTGPCTSRTSGSAASESTRNCLLTGISLLPEGGFKAARRDMRGASTT